MSLVRKPAIQRWQRTRKRYLQANPYCVECAKEGKRQLASYVDHITPHRGDHALFWNTANWQPLCFHHHNPTRMTRK